MRNDFLFSKIGPILVMAPEEFQLRIIKNALETLEKIDPEEYHKLFSRINIIFITRLPEGTNVFYMPEKIWFANKRHVKPVAKNRSEERHLQWLASKILHEGFHSTQWENGKYIASFGAELEMPAFEFEKEFLEKCGYDAAIKHLDKRYRQKYWEKMDQDTKSARHFSNLLYCLQAGWLVLKYVNLD